MAPTRRKELSVATAKTERVAQRIEHQIVAGRLGYGARLVRRFVFGRARRFRALHAGRMGYLLHGRGIVVECRGGSCLRNWSEELCHQQCQANLLLGPPDASDHPRIPRFARLKPFCPRG
jgi:hypothetical protein